MISYLLFLFLFLVLVFPPLAGSKSVPKHGQVKATCTCTSQDDLPNEFLCKNTEYTFLQEPGGQTPIDLQVDYERPTSKTVKFKFYSEVRDFYVQCLNSTTHLCTCIIADTTPPATSPVHPVNDSDSSSSKVATPPPSQVLPVGILASSAKNNQLTSLLKVVGVLFGIRKVASNGDEGFSDLSHPCCALGDVHD
ncbi:hypothetical protein SKAU_G00338620 [Synaphobranchus kaupii]|uniref:Uncharacterized protein n=1 Tax=Synaphobranchus kaupii TaxID=118154 RepID=A0A9Q1EMN2_SYNKA|nr:hypothetical protein SKAU_G00338620 [Synaphobranchus kaupii]